MGFLSSATKYQRGKMKLYIFCDRATSRESDAENERGQIYSFKTQNFTFSDKMFEQLLKYN